MAAVRADLVGNLRELADELERVAPWDTREALQTLLHELELGAARESTRGELEAAVAEIRRLYALERTIRAALKKE